jgi:hypothetical protein
MPLCAVDILKIAFVCDGFDPLLKRNHPSSQAITPTARNSNPLARCGAGDTRRAVEVFLDQLALLRVQEDGPALPRIALPRRRYSGQCHRKAVAPAEQQLAAGTACTSKQSRRQSIDGTKGLFHPLAAASRFELPEERATLEHHRLNHIPVSEAHRFLAGI